MGWDPPPLDQCLWHQVTFVIIDLLITITKMILIITIFTIITIITIHSNQDDIFNANDQEVPARGVACNAHRPTFNSCHLGHRPSWSQGTHHDDLGPTFLSLGGS